MKNTFSVLQAIERGHYLINVPVIGIIILTPAITGYFMHQNSLPIWLFPSSLIVGFVLSWLYWSFMIVKWKIWAFENVRNVHELKKMAIKEKLIWPDDNFFNKTEIWSISDRMKWKNIQLKFNQEDIYIDDFHIPSETKIYYSKLQNNFVICIMVALLLLGIYYITTTHHFTIGILFIIISTFMLYTRKRITQNINVPQIIISNQGITSINQPFVPWNQIAYSDVIKKGSGKQTRYYLHYIYSQNNIEIELSELNISTKKLNYLLYVYKNRYEQQQKPKSSFRF